jgi:ribonucleoside-diphosphate reductase alpha chain
MSIPKTGENAQLIDTEVYGIIKKHAAKLDEVIDYKRDFDYDYFGIKLLKEAT